MSSLKSKNVKHRKVLIIWLLVLSAVIVILVISGIILLVNHSKRYQISDDGKELTVGFQNYRYNENLVNVLLLGVDVRGSLVDKGIVGQGGQADAIILVSLDRRTKHMNVIWINRDSMISVARYTSAFEYYDREEMQLCLQYAYGRTHHESSTLMVERIGELFPHIPIIGYVTTNLDAIVCINDYMGGVEVTLDEDLSFYSAEMAAGSTVTVTGEMCLEYLRDRIISNINNERRIIRQKKYVTAFLKKAKAVFPKDPLLVTRILGDIQDSIRTDLDFLDIAGLITSGLQINEEQIDLLSVPGKSVVGAQYWEYRVDQAGLMDLIVQCFYCLQ